MLKKLERAVLRPRRVLEFPAVPPEEIPKKVEAEVTMLRRLRRAVLRRKGSR
jgi:hypothetical protein